MLGEQFHVAAEAARTTHELDDLARRAASANREGQIDDMAAQAVYEAIARRRKAFAAGEGFRPSAQTAAYGRPWPARRPPPRSPDRRASIERRRRQAASGAMPPALAANFTQGEIAALAVVARQFQRMQVCVLPVDAIAALAGVSRRTVQRALREAERLGFVHIRERRIPGQKSLPNIVRVVSPEWLAWLRLGTGTIGRQKWHPTGTDSLAKGKSQVSRQGRLGSEHRTGKSDGTRPASGAIQ
jgi:hypothetical protein